MTPSIHTRCGCPKCKFAKIQELRKEKNKEYNKECVERRNRAREIRKTWKRIEKWNTEIFIERSKQIHENRFDYSQTKVEKRDQKIKLKCNRCGLVFEQALSSNLEGYGCPGCYGNYQPSKTELLKKFKKIHGNRYDYSLVEYKNRNFPVQILCRKHGKFQQSAGNQLLGMGCPECGKETRYKKSSFE